MRLLDAALRLPSHCGWVISGPRCFTGYDIRRIPSITFQFLSGSVVNFTGILNVCRLPSKKQGWTTWALATAVAAQPFLVVSPRFPWYLDVQWEWACCWGRIRDTQKRLVLTRG